MNYKINYNYTDLINEIKGKIKEGLLKENEIIQVLRGERLDNLYTPIIRWYYDKGKINEVYKRNNLDTVKESLIKEKLKKKYLQDKPYLENTTVAAILVEMREMNEENEE